MAIDIQKLFEDIIPDAAKQDRNDGVDRVNAVSQLGGTAALLSPGRERRMRQAATGIAQPLFGVSFETPEEKLKKTLQGVDVRTPEGEDAAFKAISAIDGNKAIQFRIAMQEQKRAQQAQDADTSMAASAARNAATSEAGVADDVNRTQTMVIQNQNVAERNRLDAEEFGFNQIDQNRFRAIQEEQNRLEALRIEQGSTQLSNQDKTVINDAIEEAQVQMQKGVKAVGLASQYAQQQPLAGVRGNAAEAFKNFLGTQDDVSLLKTEFTSVVNAAIVNGLPPGVASDRDIDMVKQGFPTASYNADAISSYMQGMAKVAFIEAERQERKAQWAAEHKGSLAGFTAEWRRVNAEDTFIPMLEEKYGVDFLDAGEQAAVDQSAADRARAIRESRAATRPTGPSQADTNRRRSTLAR